MSLEVTLKGVLKGKVQLCVACVCSRLCSFKVCEEETSQLVNASISAFSFLKHPECSAGEKGASKRKQKHLAWIVNGHGSMHRKGERH